MQPLVISGARTILSFNGSPVAAGFVLDYTIDTAVEEISGIDNVLSEELAPTRIGVSMSLRVYRTPENDPVSLGFAPAGDQTNPGPDFAASGYITVEVKDKVTDKTILFLPRARIVRRSGSVAAEDLLTETWAIRGIGYYGPGQQVSGLIPVVQSLF